MKWSRLIGIAVQALERRTTRARTQITDLKEHLEQHKREIARLREQISTQREQYDRQLREIRLENQRRYDDMRRLERLVHDLQQGRPQSPQQVYLPGLETGQ